MDAVKLSLPLLLPPVGVRTVCASASTSSSVAPLTHSTLSHRLFSHRTRPNYCSTVPKLTVTCGAGVTEINETQFKDTVLKANRPVLVEFVATWCGPCRLISPAMESLAKQNNNSWEASLVNKVEVSKFVLQQMVVGVGVRRRAHRTFPNNVEYEDRLSVVKIDHDANPRLIEEYKVYGLPTLILFKNGEEVPESRREGAITKAKLQEYLDALLESISVS